MSSFDDAMRFGGFVLAHAAWIASGLEAEELVCPFAVVTRGDEREVIPFESNTQEDSIREGKKSLDELRGTVDYWGFAREGLWSIVGDDSPKLDVLTVSAWKNGLDEPIVLQQCFTPKTQGGFRLLGSIKIVVHGAMPPEEIQLDLRHIVMQGIAQHPKGGSWAGWADP